MIGARDPDGSDGGTLQRGEQNAPQGIAKRVTVTAFKRLGDKSGVGGGGGILILEEPLWHFESS